ncbi:putative serine esterase-domain-containing protein [Echria macrotheca]|uniref:Serine esterase-domain-containing protein n=1 Tax=Echria macrotheca TaxID=438768 RepID=A0AAJ0BA39_9PEZI|nr:putative serine esterase-domain-containing protein [Echria macrotheca]
MAEYNGGTTEADHLVVLVHGLWGNPEHMGSIAKKLREQYPPDQVYILVAKRNSGSFTYDGVELGGERVCVEIEEELELIKSRGGRINKLSVVGYSLGGLVARYAIGLLHARGVLDDLECMNFTAFASPFLGVRSPLRGWRSQLFNVLGPRTLSISGKQLFGLDKFRDTGKPLIAVLADPKSIFMSGLARFKRRTLYANVTNDRSTPYFTSAIDKTDPFTDLSKIKANYVRGYEPVLLDPENPLVPMTPGPEKEPEGFDLRDFVGRLPTILTLSVVLPLGIVAFLANAVVQTARSSKRVKMHESGLAGIPVERFRVNLWMNEIRQAVEGAYEDLGSAQRQEYLGQSADSDGEETDSSGEQILALERKQTHPDQPTLALAPYQFSAIQALDELGFRKYRVWIHDHGHTHAAIIVRSDKKGFEEGHVVLNHWVKDEFLI